MWEKKRDLIKRYNSSVESYERRYQEIQRKKFQSVLEELDEADSVLDVGCGTGLFLDEIIEKGKFVVGTDFSFKMLAKAEKQTNFASLVLADADNLPFQDGIFDAVVSLTLLQNMPDPTRTVREMSRVIKPEGKLVLTSLRKKHSVEEIEELMSSTNLKSLRVGRIPDSEDILWVGRSKG